VAAVETHGATGKESASRRDRGLRREGGGTSSADASAPPGDICRTRAAGFSRLCYPNGFRVRRASQRQGDGARGSELAPPFRLMSPTPSDLDPRPTGRRWIALVAFAFVLVTLGALVAVPILVQERVDALRDEVAGAEPARTLVSDVRFDLVREIAALSGAPTAGAPDPATAYADARADERADFDSLAALTAKLGPEARARFAEFRAAAEEWHAVVGEEEILRRGVGPGVQVEAPVERERFAAVLGAALRLDSAVLDATAANRERIRSAEMTGIWLTLLLGVLALLAAGVVAVLTARVRRYAEEAERRRAEAEAALAETARANEARARLLRGVTHDVKNPLGAAQGYAQLLAMGVPGPISPEQAPMVEGIQRSVNAALAIIADLLDVARADSGGLVVERVPADLAEVARDAVEDHRAAAEAAGHTLRFQAGRPVPVHTDPTRVRQVLGNLLSNAIKYTPAPGLITVFVEPDGEEGAPRPGRWAAVRVTDTGPGIPPELREAVFDEFTRLDEHSAAKGHGLGLAIARRIARLLGGDLSVGDADGGGAAFVLRLPCRSDASDRAEALSVADAAD
jgi:signal transduction histidine kinase